MTIQEILEAHKLMDVRHLVVTHEYCNCNELFENKTDHRAHVAEVLGKHMHEREAAEVERLAKVIEEEGEGYFRTAVTLTGDDNTRYHAYAVARQGIAHQLKFRADQIRKEPTK